VLLEVLEYEGAFFESTVDVEVLLFLFKTGSVLLLDAGT